VLSISKSRIERPREVSGLKYGNSISNVGIEILSSSIHIFFQWGKTMIRRKKPLHSWYAQASEPISSAQQVFQSEEATVAEEEEAAEAISKEEQAVKPWGKTAPVKIRYWSSRRCKNAYLPVLRLSCVLSAPPRMSHGEHHSLCSTETASGAPSHIWTSEAQIRKQRWILRRFIAILMKIPNLPTRVH